MNPKRTASENLEALAGEMRLTLKTTFVPWSQSRDYEAGKPIGERMAQWRVTLERDGRPILTTDYGQGIAHLPAYKAPGLGEQSCAYRMEAVGRELETGRTWRSEHFSSGPIPGPNLADVVWSLCMDAEVLQYRSFEDWASNLGYDTDSRKAEATYRECLAIALQLQAGLGAANLERLQEAAREV